MSIPSNEKRKFAETKLTAFTGDHGIHQLSTTQSKNPLHTLAIDPSTNQPGPPVIVTANQPDPLVADPPTSLTNGLHIADYSRKRLFPPPLDIRTVRVHAAELRARRSRVCFSLAFL